MPSARLRDNRLRAIPYGLCHDRFLRTLSRRADQVAKLGRVAGRRRPIHPHATNHPHSDRCRYFGRPHSPKETDRTLRPYPLQALVEFVLRSIGHGKQETITLRSVATGPSCFQAKSNVTARRRWSRQDREPSTPAYDWPEGKRPIFRSGLTCLIHQSRQA